MPLSVEVCDLTKVYPIFNDGKQRLRVALNSRAAREITKFVALNKVNVAVEQGETVAIIGKNGSGKSTLLKVIAGVLKPTSGQVRVEGRVASLLELGVGFNPEQTGVENVFLNGAIYGFARTEIEQRLERILNFADIGEFAWLPVRMYSSGMFARLAFSVVANFDPDVLIVDEALAVGDVYFQQKCNVYMKEAMKGVTKLLVTHDMHSVASLADRAVVLREGSVAFDGDPIAAIEEYTKSLHTEAFAAQQTGAAASHTTTAPEARWQAISPDKLGGAGEVKIVAYALATDGKEYPGYVEAGMTVELRFRLSAPAREIQNIILGYIVSDKYGNDVFGENTVTSGKWDLRIEAGRETEAGLTFTWPEIKEGEYFITLGVGEGTHELQHVIQCWAHNIVMVEAISPRRTIHCLFNNPIRWVFLG
jgi:teichoic acid transport system ATP-binding protein